MQKIIIYDNIDLGGIKMIKKVEDKRITKDEIILKLSKEISQLTGVDFTKETIREKEEAILLYYNSNRYNYKSIDEVVNEFL